ncbi:maleylpyruvate isomerase family mycothiol-dependent enzyme [Gordonia sp. (in: high G+C Gram-positive bacteria)]|uniref:maleylpyruvate isomerase family mycothiol-dependent enzyme n=1 Tax=Gordonia sp. (in: high G+C Gram-positive bacteria) TaxID=84139 RepID=UPI0025BEBC8F|nr:maleylpyruvate isomerase family mycothiol-dependent enzyme [Gordonia sp. (in: high G+C Gram-positive bacteria)]
MTEMAMMAEAEVWAEIDRQRVDLADFLLDLTDEEWDTPSLCTGWRVRDVAAHLAMAHTGFGRFSVEMVRAGLRFNKTIHDTACRHAVVPTDELAAEIRAMAGSRRKAPGITIYEPLLDVLVHGQDIAVPLGRERIMPTAAAATSATRIWTMRWPMSSSFRPRQRFQGVRLQATDTDWSVGEGELIEGPIQSLLMTLARRPMRDGELSGPGLRASPR